jgi:TP901 family phage tail tape measure protein
VDIGTLRAILEADTKAFDAALDRAETRLKSFAQTASNINVRLNTSGAIKEVTELGRAMRGIVDKNIAVNVNTSGAIAQVTALGQSLQSVQQQAASAGLSGGARGGILSSRFDPWGDKTKAQRANFASPWSPMIAEQKKAFAETKRLESEAAQNTKSRLEDARQANLASERDAAQIRQKEIAALRANIEERARVEQEGFLRARKTQEAYGAALAQDLENQQKSHGRFTDRFGQPQTVHLPFGQRMQNLQRSGYYDLAAGASLTAAVTAPVVGAGIGVAKSAADFQESMQHVVTLTDIGKSELAGLKESVLELSSDPNIRQSPKELADALYYVASTGLHSADAMQVLKASAYGASAGLGSTQTIANTVTTVLDAYGLSADKASRVTDVLTEAVRKGKGEASAYAGAFPKVIAIAAQAGVTFEEVAAQMASATRVGLTPSETGTALRQIFNNLIDPSEKAQRAMQKLGTSADEIRSKLKFEGLFNTLKDLMARSGGDIGPITELFGSIRALTAFLSTTGTGTLQAYKETLDDIQGANGSAMRAAGIASETFEFQVAKLKSTIEKTAISIGSEFLPQLTKLVETMGTTIPSALNDSIAAWNALPAPIQKVLTLLGGAVLLLGPIKMLSGTLKIMGSALGSIVQVLGNAGQLIVFFDKLKGMGAAISGIGTAISGIGTALRTGGGIAGIGTALRAEGGIAGALGIGSGGALAAGGVAATIGGLVVILESLAVVAELAGTAFYNYQAKLEDAKTAQHNLKMGADAMAKSLDRIAKFGRGDNAIQAFAKKARAEIKAAKGDAGKLVGVLESLEKKRIEVGKNMSLDPSGKAMLLDQISRLKAQIENRLGNINANMVAPDVASAVNHALQPSNQGAPSFEDMMNGRGIPANSTPQNQRTYVRNMKDKDLFAEKAKWDNLSKQGAKLNIEQRTRREDVYDDYYRRKDQIQKAREEQKGKAADAARSASDRQQEIAQQNADRLRDIEQKQLNDRAQMWERFGNQAESVIGRITQLQEQAGAAGEKTAKSRMEAEMLKRAYDGIPEPLKRAVVELAGIEAKMQKIVGIRDSFRGVFNDMLKGLSAEDSAPLRAIMAKVGKSLNLPAQWKEAQQRGDVLSRRVTGAAESNAASLSAQSEALRYGGGAESSGVGNAIAKTAMTMQTSGAARGFVHLCESLARTTVQKTTHAYDQYFSRKSALASMRNFQRAGIGTPYTPGMPVAPGGLLYSSSLGRGFGHVVTIGANGERLDQYGKNRFASRNFQWYVPPPGASSGGAATLPFSAKGGGAPGGLAPSELDMVLGQYKPLPKSWGGMTRYQRLQPEQTNQHQQAVEAQLLELLKNGAKISGATMWESRKAAVMRDAQESARTQTNAVWDSVREMNKKIRLIGKEENPYLVLLEEFEHGARQKTSKGAKSAALATSLHELVANAEHATKKAGEELRKKTRISLENSSMFNDPEFSSARYGQLQKASQNRDEVWQRKDLKDMLAIAEAKRERGDNAGAARLRAKANALAQSDIAARNNADRSDRIRAAGEAYGQMAEQHREEIGLLEYEMKLQKNLAMTQKQREESLAMEKARRDEAKRIADAVGYVSPDDPRIANAALMASESYKAKAALDALKESHEKAAAAAKKQEEDLQDLQRALATIGDESGRAALEYDLQFGSMKDLSGLEKARKLSDFDAKRKAQNDASYYKGIYDSDAEFESGNTLTNRGKLEAQLKARARMENYYRASVPSYRAEDHTDEDTQARRVADRADAQERIRYALDAQKQIEMSLARTAVEKQALEEKYQALLQSRLEMLGYAQSDADRAAQAEKNRVDEMAAASQDALDKWRENSEEMKNILRGALEEGMKDGALAGVKSFFTRVKDAVLSRGMDAIAEHLSGNLFGHKPKQANGESIIGTLGGFALSQVAPSASGIAGQLFPQSAPAHGGAVNANTIVVNGRTVNVNGNTGMTMGTQASSPLSVVQSLGGIVSAFSGHGSSRGMNGVRFSGGGGALV